MAVSTANFILPLRIVQLVLAIIVLGTAAYVVNTSPSSAEAGYMVFLPIWTFLVLGYLVAVPLFMPALHNEWAVLALEAVTMILWLAGWAALAAVVGNLICLDSYGESANCPALNAAKAAVAFGAFEWLAFCATLGLVIFGIIKSRKSSGHVDAEGGGEGGGAHDGNQQAYNMYQTPAQPTYVSQ